MSTRRHFLALSLSACIAFSGMAGCNRQPPQSQVTKPIRVAFNTWIGYSSFYIAEEQGLFRKRGIEVETRVIDPLAEKNAAMLRGELDAMGGTIDSAVISAAAGVPGKIVFMFDRSNGTDGILVTKDIRTVKDLKGKRVAVEEGFVGHFFLLYVLQKEGMSQKDVTLVPMKTDDAGAAFVAGKVDVAVTWEPYLSTAAKRPGAHVLVSSAALDPILADTLFVSNHLLEARPEAVESLVGALQEANEWWISNRNEANRLVAKRWKMDLKEVANIMQTDELYSRQRQKQQFGQQGLDGDLYQYLKTCADLWLKAGVIDRSIDAASLVEPRFVRALSQNGRG